MDSYTIQKLLHSKHYKDIYIPECKTGPTQGYSHLRLDGLAIKRAWENPVVTGYEIKVSRGDFMNDEKFHGYLPYCNEFYFVCPPQLIQPEELPNGIGLYWVSKNAKRLYKKKKAHFEDKDIPGSIYKYVLIARATIEKPGFYLRENKKYYWENWLENKQIDYSFGDHVSRAIREEVDKKIWEVENENKALLKRIEEYEDIKKLLVAADIDITDKWGLKYRVKDKMQEIRENVPDYMIKNIERSIEGLKEFLEKYGKKKS